MLRKILSLALVTGLLAGTAQADNQRHHPRADKWKDRQVRHDREKEFEYQMVAGAIDLIAAIAIVNAFKGDWVLDAGDNYRCTVNLNGNTVAEGVAGLRVGHDCPPAFDDLHLIGWRMTRSGHVQLLSRYEVIADMTKAGRDRWEGEFRNGDWLEMSRP